MRLLIRDGNDLIDTKSFTEQAVCIGAGEDCDIRLPDLRLPPELATLKPNADAGWTLEPAHDGIRLQLNGRPVRQPTPVGANDEIGIEQFTIAVCRTPGETMENGKTQTAVSRDVAELRAHPLPPGSKTRTVKDDLLLAGDAPYYGLSFAEELTACTDLPRLIDRLMEELFARFAGRRSFAGVRRNETSPLEFVQCRSVDGSTADDPPFLNSYVYRCLERDHAILVPSDANSDTGSALAAPMINRGKALGLLYTERKPTDPPFERKDIDTLSHIACIGAARLGRVLAQQEEIQQSASAGELAFVRAIQARMDPSVVPQWPGLQTAVFCKPGNDRAGDVYDLLRMPNGLAMIFLGSVKGETTRAAVAMAEMRSAFRTAALHMDAPHTYMRTANWLLVEDRMNCQMSAVAIVLNPQTGELQYATSGDIGAMIVDNRGDSRDLNSHDTPPAGLSAGFAYEAGIDQLLPGESLALFTHGCCTVRNKSGEMLGHDGLVECIRDGFGQSASVALNELVRDHAAFFRDGQQPDDITILFFNRLANTEDIT